MLALLCALSLASTSADSAPSPPSPPSSSSSPPSSSSSSPPSPSSPSPSPGAHVSDASKSSSSSTAKPDAAKSDASSASTGKSDAAKPDDGKRSKLDELLDDLFAGTWLDPKDPYWNPRRGERFEISALLGGEAAFSAVEASTKLPSIGGTVLNGVVRYYPVDRLAVVFGARTYVGLDGVPAAGTTASSVISIITGVRYDLVRENRFSLLWDLYSGPSLYVIAPVSTLSNAQTALGGEMGTALAMRYSIGPFTGEARGVVGGRAGATSHPFQRAGGSGPFSALYAGVDLGGTWSMQ